MAHWVTLEGFSRALLTALVFTVVHTPAFAARARKRLTEAEIARVEVELALNPEAGATVSGAKGIRKLRVATGKGKSGGARVIYFFRAPSGPVFLLDVYAKNEKANLTQKEWNTLAKALANL